MDRVRHRPASRNLHANSPRPSKLVACDTQPQPPVHAPHALNYRLTVERLQGKLVVAGVDWQRARPAAWALGTRDRLIHARDSHIAPGLKARLAHTDYVSVEPLPAPPPGAMLHYLLIGDKIRRARHA